MSGTENVVADGACQAPCHLYTEAPLTLLRVQGDGGLCCGWAMIRAPLPGSLPYFRSDPLTQASVCLLPHCPLLWPDGPWSFPGPPYPSFPPEPHRPGSGTSDVTGRLFTGDIRSGAPAPLITAATPSPTPRPGLAAHWDLSARSQCHALAQTHSWVSHRSLGSP